MLKRKIISQLEEWKDSHSHEALLIKGARQVGKTWLMVELGKKYYKDYVVVNFDHDKK